MLIIRMRIWCGCPPASWRPLPAIGPALRRWIFASRVPGCCTVGIEEKLTRLNVYGQMATFLLPARKGRRPARSSRGSNNS